MFRLQGNDGCLLHLRLGHDVVILDHPLQRSLDDATAPFGSSDLLWHFEGGLAHEYTVGDEPFGESAAVVQPTVALQFLGKASPTCPTVLKIDQATLG